MLSLCHLHFNYVVILWRWGMMILLKGCDSWRSILVCAFSLCIYIMTMWLFCGDKAWWSFQKNVIDEDPFLYVLFIMYLHYDHVLFGGNDTRWSFKRMWFIVRFSPTLKRNKQSLKAPTQWKAPFLYIKKCR